MANNEQQGVVDRNLKVFGVDNLYVCDGSIFTTAGNVNISFTISAFACRLSEYLLSRKKKITTEATSELLSENNVELEQM